MRRDRKITGVDAAATKIERTPKRKAHLANVPQKLQKLVQKTSSETPSAIKNA
jgi:hypothetical protein